MTFTGSLPRNKLEKSNGCGTEAEISKKKKKKIESMTA